MDFYNDYAEEQADALAEEEAQKSDDLDRAYLSVFTSGQGQMVLEDLFWAYFERPSFNPELKDPTTHLAFLEGQRSVLLDIRASMRRAEAYDGPEPRATIEELKR